MSSAHIAWNGGGTAVLEIIDGDRVELISTRPFAPGARPEGSFTVRPLGGAEGPADSPGRPAGSAVDSSAHPIWMKSHGSRRQEDGTYRVKGRLLNVRREVLDILKEVVGGSNDGKSSTS